MSSVGLALFGLGRMGMILCYVFFVVVFCLFFFSLLG